MRRVLLAVGAAALVAAGALAILGRGAAPPAALAVPPEERLLLSFEAAAVDGISELRFRGRDAALEGPGAEGFEDVSIEVHAPLPPAAGQRFYVRSQIGRPQVSVMETPGVSNAQTLRLRIDDARKPGPAPLRFELVAAPVRDAPNPKNVVIVTLDSLRADRLGVSGYGRPTTPNLDAFAAESVRFTNAFSTSSFTPPSHASLLTSRWVGHHGLLTWNALPAEQLTLPEILSRYGYRTGASVNLQLLSGQGLGQGVAWQREGLRDGSGIVREALEFMQEEPGRPFFLWLHFYDVHRPYKRPTDVVGGYGRYEPVSFGDVNEDYNLEPEDVEERGLGADALRYVSDRYDNGVIYTDTLLAPLLAALAAPERRADTLVILTADHGESLLEHPERLFSHDPFLLSVVTRIPLLMRYPGAAAAGSVRSELVSLVDLAPTVLEVLGVDAPASFEGKSLVGLNDGRPFARDVVFQEAWGWSQQKAARSAGRLVVHDAEADETRAYDLATDPSERSPKPTSLAAKSGLEAALAAFASREDPQAAPELSPELVEQLEALGYVD